MSMLTTRLHRLEQTPAYATKLLARQALEKLDAGVSPERLSNAEIAAVIRTAPAEERAQIEALSDAQLDALIAGQWPRQEES